MKLKKSASMVLRIFVLAGIVASQLIFSQGIIYSQDQETLNIMERLQKLAQETGSYQAEVTTVLTKKGKTSVIKGKMKFMWPNMRWEESRHSTKRGIRLALSISNGKIRWNYIPSLKFAFKHDMKSLDEDARQKGWASAGYLEEDTFQYLGSAQLENVEVFIFEGKQNVLRAPRNSKEPGRARVYFGAQDGILRKMVELDHEGSEVASKTIFNIRIDPSISQKDFEFTPSEGTQITEVKDIGPRRKPKD
jgi:outer membrane lipoprotein-sorting protein